MNVESNPGYYTFMMTFENALSSLFFKTWILNACSQARRLFILFIYLWLLGIFLPLTYLVKFVLF